MGVNILRRQSPSLRSLYFSFLPHRREKDVAKSSERKKFCVFSSSALALGEWEINNNNVFGETMSSHSYVDTATAKHQKVLLRDYSRRCFCWLARMYWISILRLLLLLFQRCSTFDEIVVVKPLMILFFCAVNLLSTHSANFLCSHILSNFLNISHTLSCMEASVVVVAQPRFISIGNSSKLLQLLESQPQCRHKLPIEIRRREHVKEGMESRLLSARVNFILQWNKFSLEPRHGSCFFLFFPLSHLHPTAIIKIKDWFSTCAHLRYATNSFQPVSLMCREEQISVMIP